MNKQHHAHIVEDRIKRLESENTEIREALLVSNALADKQRGEIAALKAQMKEAFIEGFNSYATNCCSFNTESEAWDESDAKSLLTQTETNDA